VKTGSQPRYWRRPLDADDIPRTRGIVHIREERCKGCSYCVDFCPRDVLKLSERFNAKGYHPPDVLNATACTACHLCELLCPEFAITVEETVFQEVEHAC
jgi:2-oxoglutarate ferredoxin oxidoreductase subunit delta